MRCDWSEPFPDEAILAEVTIPFVLGGAEKPDWERDIKPCEQNADET